MSSSAPTASIADLTASRILVVDDEAANVALLSQMLTRAGYSYVLAITDPSEVADRVRTFEPDLIMLDLHMPPPDGFAVLEQLHEIVAADDFLPVLVLTADATDAAKERALGDGAHDFLTKPFHYPEMLLRIRNLLRTRVLHRELRRHNAVLATQLAEHGRAEGEVLERRRVITARTERVLAGDGLAMVFQPVVDLADGSVAGAEALSRFDAEPKRPDLWFIEAAEVGLGVQLEIAAITAALAQIDRLPPGSFLSINASADTIRSEALARRLEPFPAERLVVELTEHDRIADYAPLDAALAGLRRRGVRLAVDDTGAGFASLQHILKLAPDLIKLDRGLITAIDEDPVRRSLVSALVHFATETGALLIAEGIETDAELGALGSLGVRHGQGYLLARPAPLPIEVAPLDAWTRKGPDGKTPVATAGPAGAVSPVGPVAAVGRVGSGDPP